MSTQAVQAIPAAKGAAAAKAAMSRRWALKSAPDPAQSAKVKEIPIKQRPMLCQQKAGLVAQKALRDAAWQMVENGYGYKEAQELFRLCLMSAAMNCEKGVLIEAAARLKITRTHLDNYLSRGKGLLCESAYSRKPRRPKK